MVKRVMAAFGDPPIPAGAYPVEVWAAIRKIQNWRTERLLKRLFRLQARVNEKNKQLRGDL